MGLFWDQFSQSEGPSCNSISFSRCITFLDFATPLGFISYFGGIFWAIAIIIWLSTAVYKRTKTEVIKDNDSKH